MAKKYVKSIKFSQSGETYYIRDAEAKDRLDTLEPSVQNLETTVAGKQDKLTAGANITIENNVISATGGGTGAVESVNGKTGVVNLSASDVHAATEAQGALADTAVQPAAIADMATKTELSAKQDKLTSANQGANVVITEESGVVKISATGSLTSVNWGGIDGTLSDQHDLQEALNAKASSSDLAGKQDKLTSANAGTNVTITEESGVVKINATGSGGVSNYDDLNNTPSIESHPLNGGNNTAASLGLATSTQLASKQDTLVSGTNIKTINNASILDSGNLELLTSSDVGTMAAESKDNYYTKTEADDEFVSSSEGAEIQNRLDVILEQTPVQDIDTLSLETTILKDKIWSGGYHTEGTAGGWKHYIIYNDNYTTLNVDVFSGNYGESNPYCIYFYSDKYVFDSTTYISGAIPCTTAGVEEKQIVDVPKNTKVIIVNYRTASGNISVLANGYQESGRIADIEKEIDNILNSEEKVKDGLIISVLGASTSTKLDKDAYELTITEQDIGVPLSAYLTYYDYYGLSGSTPVGLTIGGHTFTDSEIGQEVYFTPTAEDVGKSLGLALRYAGNDNTKVWWEYLEDMGATVVPVCWSGSSITSHEESTKIRRTSYSWHDAQIRKLGVRIPGSMQRKAPDIIIMNRGGNDMTHAPYSLLTDGYFDDWDWSYPTTDEVTGGWGLKEGLSLWIKKVRDAYPFARIIIATGYNLKRINCSKFPVNNGLYSLPQLNDAYREAARFFGCQTIDFDCNGMTFENIYPEYINDSASIPTHPNNKGHAMLAKQAIIDLKSKVDFLHLDHEDRNSKLKMKIDYVLSNVTSSNTDTSIALGETYTTTLSPTESTVVTIRQGGADITSKVYNVSTGVVTINPVDGNISIEASWAGTSYTVTNNLTHVTNLNSETTIPELNAYDAWLSSDDGYIKDSVTITMGGTDITSTVYSDGHIIIPSVTGNIVITASAVETTGGSYKIFNKRTGLLNGASPTSYNMSNLSKAVITFNTTDNLATSGGGACGGIYAKLFCTMYSKNGHVEFGTAASSLTGVISQKNTKYIAVLDNINQATSSLTIYAGDDENLITPLGTTTRTATVNWPYAIYGTYSDTNQGYTTAVELYSTKLYDTTGNLVRDYVPATRLSDSVQGSYDRLTGEFVPIVVDQ